MVQNIDLSYGHVFCATISLIITVLLSAAQADGRSFVKTDNAVGAPPGTRAGLGVWKDYEGHAWVNPKNPGQVCDNWIDMAQTIVSFVFIPTVLSGVLVVIHLFALQARGQKPVLNTVAIVLNVANNVSFVIALGVAAAVFDRTYCNLRIGDLFDINYAIPLLVVGIVATTLNIVVLHFIRVGASGEAESNEPIAEVEKDEKAASAV